MEIDWTLAKKNTLWEYEELIEKMLDVLDYGFVQEFYNHNMEEAASYSQELQRGYLLNGKEATFITDITKKLGLLKSFGVKNYLDLVWQVKTKESCESFLKKVDFSFETLIHLLNYFFRWVFPFKSPVRELVEAISGSDKECLSILKKFMVRFNLDVLEKCRTRENRILLSKETGMSKKFILELTNRADLSRLAYVRGKTIKHLCGGGYNTLVKIADANMQQMEKDMTEYYKRLGKSFSDFKNVIPLDWMIGGAKVLPKIVEV